MPRHVSRPVAELTRLTEKVGTNGTIAKGVGHLNENMSVRGSVMPATLLVLVPVRERDFRQHVLSLMGMLGWRSYFTWTSLHSPAGFPDIVAVKGKRIIFAELKVKTKVTPSQQSWLDDLKEAGQETYLWIWREGILQEIADVLAREEP